MLGEICINSALISDETSSVPINSWIDSLVIAAFVLVNPFKASYGFGYASRRKIVWIASATTAQFLSKSSANFGSFNNNLFKPFNVASNAIKVWRK